MTRTETLAEMERITLAEIAEARTRMAEYREHTFGWVDARDDLDDAEKSIARIRRRMEKTE